MNSHQDRGAASALEVLRNLLKIFDAHVLVAQRALIQAMLDMILNENSLRFLDGLRNGVHLAGNVEARLFVLDHLNHGFEMALGSL